MKLPYLFIAEFLNGDVIEQTQEDKALLHQEGSRFRDVALYHSPVKNFELHSINGVDYYGIDLTTLNFCANGRQFRLHSARDLPMHDIELVFFRVRNEAVNVTVQIQEDLSPKEIDREVLESQFSHCILGWKAKDRNGNEVSKTIEFE